MGNRVAPLPEGRLTRRPIPADRERWQNEVAGVRRFLAVLDGRRTLAKLEWTRKQRAYYRTRLKDLLMHPPPPEGE